MASDEWVLPILGWSLVGFGVALTCWMIELSRAKRLASSLRRARLDWIVRRFTVVFAALYALVGGAYTYRGITLFSVPVGFEMVVIVIVMFVATGLGIFSTYVLLQFGAEHALRNWGAGD